MKQETREAIREILKKMLITENEDLDECDCSACKWAKNEVNPSLSAIETLWEKEKMSEEEIKEIIREEANATYISQDDIELFIEACEDCNLAKALHNKL